MVKLKKSPEKFTQIEKEQLDCFHLNQININLNQSPLVVITDGLWGGRSHHRAHLAR